MMLLTIKTAAAQAGLSPGTLRTYERAGLLSPQRNSAGQRVYTPLDVQQAKRIAAEREAGRVRGLRSPRMVEATA